MSKKPNRILVSAYSIYVGGGCVLLNDLLEVMDESYDVLVYCDERFEPSPNIKAHITFIKVKPLPHSRILAEKKMAKISEKFDLLFCFANLPPLFEPKIKTVIFVQNKFLIGKKFINWNSWKSVVRSFGERFWFNTRKSKDYLYVIQTESMRRDIQESLGEEFSVKVFPFIKNPPKRQIEPPPKGHGPFIYVASGDPHKNHKALIETWKELKKEDVNEPLTLILNRNVAKNLCNWIEREIKKNNLNIKIEGPYSKEKLNVILKDYHCLIFPSFFESFGMPLLEAQYFGLDILAPELDYIRDLLDPKETFDPNSPQSIKRAILRYLGKHEKRAPILSPQEFIEEVIKHPIG